MARPVTLAHATAVNDFLDSNKFGAIKGDVADIKGLKVDQLFSEAELENLRFELAQKCARVGDVTAVLAEARILLDDVAKFTREHANCARQENEIRRYELKPGHDALSGLVFQEESSIPIEGVSARWMGDERSRVSPSISSIWGGSKESREYVRTNAQPIIHTQKPPLTYRNLVFDERRAALDDVRVGKARLWSKIEKDADLTAKEESRLRKVKYRTASNLAEATTFGVTSLVNRLGRGVISHRIGAETQNFQDYLKKKDDLVSLTRFKLDKNKNIAFLRELQRKYAELANSGDLEARAQFVEMEKAIEDEIKAVNDINTNDLKKFNDDIQALNAATLKKIEDITDKEDGLWKFRVMQALLCLSPLGLFNYMMPLAQFLGPMLSTSLNFGEGLGAVVSSPVLGPFGKLAEYCEIDTAVSWLANNTPVVRQFGQLFDTVTNSADDIFGMMSPMISGSPLPMVGIALGASVIRADTEVQQHITTSETLKKADKELEAAFDKLGKVVNDPTSPNNKRIYDFSTKELKIAIDGSLIVNLADFIAQAEDAELAIFDALKFKDGATNVTLSQLRRSGKISSVSDVMPFLLGVDKNVRSAALKNFFAYQGIHDEDKNTAQNVAEYQAQSRNPQVIDKLAAREKLKFEQDYIIDLAENKFSLQSIYKINPADSEEDRDKMRQAQVLDYQKQILEARVKSRAMEREVVTADRPKLNPGPAPLYPVAQQPYWAAQHAPQTAAAL